MNLDRFVPSRIPILYLILAVLIVIYLGWTLIVYFLEPGLR